MLSGWYRIDKSDAFQYWDESQNKFLEGPINFALSEKYSSVIGPHRKPRSRAVRTLLVGVGVLLFTLLVVGFALNSNQSSNQVDAFSRLFALGIMMYLSRKVGYRWFDAFIIFIPFAGSLYMARTLWRISILPHRYWSERNEVESKESNTLISQNLQNPQIDIPAIKDVRAQERAFAGVEDTRFHRNESPSTAVSNEHSQTMPTLQGIKREKVVLSFLGLVIFLIASLNVLHQYQFQTLVKNALEAQSRVEIYSNYFQVNKPNDTNGDGFAEYQNYVGQVAWDVFIQDKLSITAKATASEMLVLNYQLEQSKVFPLFGKTKKAKSQLLEYYANFYNYFVLTGKCSANDCYSKAFESLGDVQGRANLVALTLKEASPRFDFFKVKQEIAKLPS